MPDFLNSQVTQLLIDWKNGNPEALDQLLDTVEPELRRIARNYMRNEKNRHVLQTTALINETFIKLVDADEVNWQNRAHFYGICARIMRRILIKYAREKAASKRGSNIEFCPLEGLEIMSEECSNQILALNEALEKLARIDQLKSQIVELRFFSGLTLEETAKALGIAPITVSVNWRLARAWLLKEISE